jgi:hypothetical protein
MICTTTCHGALRDTAIVSVKCEAKSNPKEATGYNTIVKMGNSRDYKSGLEKK